MILRVAVLTGLVQSLAELGVVAKDASSLGLAQLAVDPTTGVERAVRALRLFAELDWQVFFEETSRVEAVLRTDPAGIYQRMDFATSDSYRKAIEDLAWVCARTGRGRGRSRRGARVRALPRTSVADMWATTWSTAGRSELERELGYRATGLERVRRMVLRRPTLAYLGTLSLLTGLLLILPGWYAVRSGAGLLPSLAVLLLALGPAAVISVAVVQRVIAKLLPPRALPKLEFAKGLPEDARSLVAIPTLLGRPEDVPKMARQLELHYLSNPDPQLQFALLTDDADGPAPPASGDLLDSAAEAIASLNAKHGKDGTGPFHLLHRQPRWNPSEECFMGWERKRGKLEELNRLLRGDESGSYVRHEGAAEGLERIRFVITLDSDTELPMGSAHRLIGVLAHPLNRAIFDEKTGRVESGYTIVQPRVQTSPASSSRTRFHRIFAGDTGFDIYTHASSDLYQDLFGSGIYVGKGIYDVDAFTRSLEGRTPENAILSHDLFEGIHGRAALASDVVLFEDYPSGYAAYARRMHRWICGDWQLLPWLLPEVPASRGAKLRNRLSLIDRWKIADNLRRSLKPPLLVLLLVCGWTWLPGAPLVWTLGTLSVLFAPLLLAIVRGRPRFEDVERSLLALVFLAHEAAVVVDAVARTLARVVFTHRHLLQWTSAADTARTTHGRLRLWRQMLASPLLALLTGATVAWVRPSALVVGLPVLLAWLLAPAIARWMSRVVPDHAEPWAPRTCGGSADWQEERGSSSRRSWARATSGCPSTTTRPCPTSRSLTAPRPPTSA